MALLIKTEPLDEVGLVKFGFESYLTFIIEFAFDLDHITALWFVTSPLAMPCVILGTFCWAVAIMLVVVAGTVIKDRIRIDAIINEWGVDDLPAIGIFNLEVCLKCSVGCSGMNFVKLYS